MPSFVWKEIKTRQLQNGLEGRSIHPAGGVVSNLQEILGTFVPELRCSTQFLKTRPSEISKVWTSFSYFIFFILEGKPF